MLAPSFGVTLEMKHPPLDCKVEEHPTHFRKLVTSVKLTLNLQQNSSVAAIHSDKIDVLSM